MRALGLVSLLVLVACGEPSPPPAGRGVTEAVTDPPPTAAAPSATPTRTDYPPVDPPAPGTPGGLPDDRTPVSEAPFTPESAQGAANFVQMYFALLGEAKYAEAFKLWSDGGKASGRSESAFVAEMSAYPQYDAQIGAPGQIEGAAGSLYVEVPVVIYGRKPDGAKLHQKGKAVLRRVNDVPGSTPEQRRWHIARFDLKS